MTTTAPERLADDLTRQVVRALEFAGRVVDDLECTSTVRGETPSTSVFGASPSGLAAKVVAETAMLLYAVAHLRATRREVDSAVGSLAERLIPLARSADVQAALCMDPSHSLDLAMSHVLLDNLGHRDSPFDELLKVSLRTGREMRPEQLPHRRLEHEWLERIWPWGVPSKKMQTSALAASSLGRPLNVLQADRADIYAFTHAVLYASDVGRRPLVTSRRRAEIGADAAAVLGFALDTQDHDLTAEVLWTWPMLGLRWQPGARLALERLVDVQDALGFLPGRGFDSKRTTGVSREQAERHIRSSCYHATYVFGFLCAAALRPNRLPSSSPRRRRPGHRVRERSGAGAAMLTLLDMEDAPNPWCAGLALQGVERQDDLAPLLLSVALRRAAEKGDLGAIRSTLRAAQAYRLEDGPAPTQAAHLLMRGQTLARALPSREDAASGATGCDIRGNRAVA